MKAGRQIIVTLLTVCILWAGLYMMVLREDPADQPEGTADSSTTGTTDTVHATPPEPTEATEPPKTSNLSDMEVELRDTDFVKITDLIPDAQIRLAYAATDNFTGQRIYAFTDAYLRCGTLNKLVKVQQELAAQGYGLLIWDAYRPMSAQERLWEICPDPAYVSDPATGNCTHCRGSAVDVTLVDLTTGETLEMPSGFDEFSALGDRDYSDCSETAAANAALLEEVMVRNGFKPYSGEWWHYTDTTEYSKEESFDPAMGQFWYANCNEYINLRAKPESGSDVLTTIPAGEVVRLIAWDTRYALVEYEGQQGYALASYLKPVDQAYLEYALDTVVPTDTYTYEQMLADLESIAGAYPELVTLGSIGTSELGRDLPVVILGDVNAEHQVLIHGSIHAREHACTWLLMALVDYWTGNGIGDYGDVCFHIIPMVNPDGVTIVQTGELPQELQSVYDRDVAQGYTSLSLTEYAAQWKANGKGVDLNRNFDAGWELFADRGSASSERYKGEAPFSASEAKALRDYTLKYDFDVTVSYHAMGSMIYYEYGSRTDVNAASLDLSRTIGNVNGYPSLGSDGLDAAGYKDWAIDSLGIPSLTIEIGSESAPLKLRELDAVFARNLQVLPLIAQWVQDR